jgi:thiol-disulfide isomerase/thioredoxin
MKDLTQGGPMRKGVLGFALIILSIVSLARCSRPPAEPGAFAVGQTAPGFTLADLKGANVSLDQYKGQIVLLDFWATWCGPCRMTMPVLEKLREEQPDIAMLAINLEEPRDLVRDYVERQRIRSRILLDADGKVGRAYGSDAIPMQVLIDKEGIVRHVQTGFSPRMDLALRSEIEKLR